MPRRLERGARLVLASHNKGKLAEIAELLAPYAITIASAAALGLPEPDETEPDFGANARLKALAAAKAANLPALADDFGFCASALDGRPGIHSARWAGPDRDFSAAMARVHAEIGENPDRRAWFVSALALAWPDGHTETFLGRVDGAAVWPPRGTNGFGYDPMFLPFGSSLTYGEMTPGQKRADTHRARAFERLRAACLD